MRMPCRLCLAVLFALLAGAGVGALLAHRATPAGTGETAFERTRRALDVPTTLPGQSRVRFRQLDSALRVLGCQGCHGLPGPKPVQAELGPELTTVRRRLSASWLVHWLRDGAPQSVRGRMHRFGLREEEAQAIAAFLWQQPGGADPLAVGKEARGFHRRATPAPDHFDELLCMDCHVYAGRKLTESVGCLSCHRIDGKGGRVGPDLTRAGEKLRYSWLEGWVHAPASARPGTPMPDLRLGSGEARCIAAYLAERVDVNNPACSPGEIQEEITRISDPGEEALRTPVDPRQLQGLLTRKAEQLALLKRFRAEWEQQEARVRKSLEAKGAAERGRGLVERAACTGCHRIIGVPPAAAAPPLRLQGSAPDRFRAAHANADAARERKPADTPIPTYELTAEETKAVGEWLEAAARNGPEVVSLAGVSAAERMLVEGRELVDRFHCTACHSLEAAGGRLTIPCADFSPEKGTVPGGCPPLGDEGKRAHPDWLAIYLRAPDALRPEVTVPMPTFSLSGDEQIVLVKFFQALAGRAEPPTEIRWMPDAATRDRGKALFEKLECGSCHLPPKVAGGGKTLKGPLVSGMRERLRLEWVVDWLGNPSAVHPGTKMPTFDLSEKERRAVALYVLSRPHEVVEREGGIKLGGRQTHHPR